MLYFFLWRLSIISSILCSQLKFVCYALCSEWVPPNNWAPGFSSPQAKTYEGILKFGKCLFKRMKKLANQEGVHINNYIWLDEVSKLESGLKCSALKNLHLTSFICMWKMGFIHFSIQYWTQEEEDCRNTYSTLGRVKNQFFCQINSPKLVLNVNI